MSTPGQTDFSREAIPETWTEAAAEAPSGDGRARVREPEFKAPPVRDTLDLFTACLAASAVSIVGGVGWYQLQVTGVGTPWTAVALGLAIALAVRLGGGSHDSQTRGILSLLFYIATAALVIFLVTSNSYETLYNASPNWSQFEDELLHSRLTEPLSIVAWFAGAATSVWASKLLR